MIDESHVQVSFNSEHDHLEHKVKRRNLTTLFLDNLHADQFITTHIFGGIDDMMEEADDGIWDRLNMSHALNDSLANESLVQFSTSFIKQRKR